MRLPVVLAATAVVAAAGLLAPAVASLGDVLAANTWRIPVPHLDVLVGPREAPTGGPIDGEDGNVGDPPPPVVYHTTTEITESPERIEKGLSFVVEGDVAAVNGPTVEGATVVLYLNETKESPGFRVGRTTTDSTGHFRFTVEVPDWMEARRYQVVASTLDTLKGNELFLESWSDPPTVVHSETAMELRAPDTAATRQTVTIYGWLRDVRGAPVREVEVTLLVDGETISRTVTRSDGYWSFDHAFEKNGRHLVEVRFDANEFYGASSARHVIEVGGAGHEIVSKPSVYRGERLELGGRLTDGDDDPVSGAEIRVEFMGLAPGGRETHTFRTGADGTWDASLAVPRDATPERYDVRYTVAAFKLEQEETVAVLARTNLTLVAPRTLAADADLKARITLVDDLGEPLPRRGLEFEVGEHAVPLRTDENGTVQFRASDPPGGTWPVKARFGGDAFYAGSEASVEVDVALSIAEEARSLLPYVLALLALAAVAFALLRPRSRRAMKAVVAALDRRGAVELTIDLPDVEVDLPDVWGVGEPLRVLVRASTEEGHPLAGLPIDAHVGSLQRVRADEAGLVALDVSFAEEGVADLRAVFEGDRQRRPADATRPVRVVEYRRVIEEGFEDLRAELSRRDVPVHGATPPRELERRIHALLPSLAKDDLDRLLTLFEVSDYSERPIGRADWIAFHRTKTALERALEATPRAT